MSVTRFLLCVTLIATAGVALAIATGKGSLQWALSSALAVVLLIGDAIVNALQELASKSSKGVG